MDAPQSGGVEETTHQMDGLAVSPFKEALMFCQKRLANGCVIYRTFHPNDDV